MNNDTSVARVELTPTDIEHYSKAVPLGAFHPSWCHYEAWAAAGPKIQRIDALAGWALGEWLLFGEDQFGEMASQMFPVDWRSSKCRKARWLCRKVPVAQRRYHSDLISFEHHAVLGGMEESERELWLDWIERQPGGVAVPYLRNAVKKWGLPPDTPEGRALIEENHKVYIEHKREMEAAGVPVDMYGVPPLPDEEAEREIDLEEPPPERYILPEPVFLLFKEAINFVQRQEGHIVDSGKVRQFKTLMTRLAAECRKHMEHNIVKGNI